MKTKRRRFLIATHVLACLALGCAQGSMAVDDGGATIVTDDAGDPGIEPEEAGADSGSQVLTGEAAGGGEGIDSALGGEDAASEDAPSLGEDAASGVDTGTSSGGGGVDSGG